MNRFNEFSQALDEKADRSELEELEARLQEQINALERALAKAKKDLKRAMKVLDDRIKRLQMDKTKNRSQSNDKMEDGMFMTKPLEPWKCASCEKGLTNIIGKPAEYYNWKRMPQREDRIPMIG